jgi:hypothetical protein
MEDFQGPLPYPNDLVLIHLSCCTDGQVLTAYATDGTETALAIDLWFKGPVTNNVVNLQDEFGKGADLKATLTPQFATGTVTYKDVPFPFTVQPTDPPIHAGLYQGELTTSMVSLNPSSGSSIQAGLYQGELTTAGGVRYLAGWIVLPSTAVAQVQREGIINEQTRALTPAPTLTALDIASGQVVEPSLGVMFRLTLIQLGKSSPPQIAVTPSPPVLSVSPEGFRLPGDPNCSFDSKTAFWNCTATLTNSGQSDLKWSASSNPSGVTFNPPSGILSAGQTTSVIISLLGYFCTDSILTFSGPENNVTVEVSGCPPK